MMMNDRNFMKAILNCPRESYDLARNLGSALDALTVYQSTMYRPEQVMAHNSKRGLAVSKGRVCIGIINTMQKKVGIPILTEYIREDEDILVFIQDLDEFFHDLYVA